MHRGADRHDGGNMDNMTGKEEQNETSWKQDTRTHNKDNHSHMDTEGKDTRGNRIIKKLNRIT